MKSPASSKSRLKGYISDERRTHLSLALFNETIIKLKKAILSLNSQFDIAVVTESNEINCLSRSKSVKVISSVETKSLSGYLDAAALWAKEKNYKALCIVPADLADPKLSDLEKLLSYPIRHSEMVICPAKDLGTNALFISPPTAFKFSFGKKSFLRHLQLAESNYIKPIILPLDSIKKDVDTTEDLDWLLTQKPQFLQIGAPYD